MTDRSPRRVETRPDSSRVRPVALDDEAGARSAETELPRGARHEEPLEFAVALRRAIAARGLSLERLRYHLRLRGHEVSVATLSYWQSGRSRPDRASSRAALCDLELILRLPVGELTGRLPERRRRGAAPTSGMATMIPDGGRLDQIVADLGLSWEDGLERVSIHDLVQIRSDQRGGVHTVREVVRAHRDGIDRFPLWCQHAEPGRLPFFMPGLNCHLGTVVEIPELRMAVAEMRLNETVNTGDSLLLEYTLAVDREYSPATRWERACLHPVRELMTEVQFGTEVPNAAWSVTEVNGVRATQPLTASAHTLRVLHLDFGPGRARVEWSW